MASFTQDKVRDVVEIASNPSNTSVRDPIRNNSPVNSDTPFVLAYVNDSDTPRSTCLHHHPLLSVLPTRI